MELAIQQRKWTEELYQTVKEQWSDLLYTNRNIKKISLENVAKLKYFEATLKKKTKIAFAKIVSRYEIPYRYQIFLEISKFKYAIEPNLGDKAADKSI
jgi:hypothetical protein